MKAQNIIQQLSENIPGIVSLDDESKSLLREMCEYLAILAEPYRARQPPTEATEPVEEKRVIIERPGGERIDVTWILNRPMYDNSHFCRIFNIQPPTAQKWRSERKIKYFRIGRTVWYPAEEIILLIQTYVSKRPIEINQIDFGDSEDFKPINNY